MSIDVRKPWLAMCSALVAACTASHDGGRYGGDGVIVWLKGDVALLSVDDTSFPPCQINRRESIWEHAKLSGVDFRAVGNEPGWHMDIRDGDRISLTYDYGEHALEVPAPEPEVDADQRRTEYRAGLLVIQIIGETCHDTMSGEAFDARVTLQLEGRELHGCGRALH